MTLLLYSYNCIHIIIIIKLLIINELCLHCLATSKDFLRKHSEKCFFLRGNFEEKKTN